MYKVNIYTYVEPVSTRKTKKKIRLSALLRREGRNGADRDRGTGRDLSRDKPKSSK